MKLLMRIIQATILPFAIQGTLLAVDIYVEPQGEYREIEEFPEFENTQALAEAVTENPGKYAPPVLVAAGIYYITTHDIEKAVTFCAASLHRATIDAHLSGDKTVAGVPTMFSWCIAEAAEDVFTNEECIEWNDKLLAALKDFEAWDRATPREYDSRWIYLHGMGAFTGETLPPKLSESEQRKVIERYYRITKGTVLEEDITATPDDPVYFDRESRVITHKESGVSFFVPERLEVPLDLNGKYDLPYSSDQFYDMSIITGWSSDVEDIESNYNWQTECYSEECVEDDYYQSKGDLQWWEVGDGLRAFSNRYITRDGNNEPRGRYDFHLVNGHASMDICIEYRVEDEDEVLKELEPMWKSIRLKSA